MKFSEIVENLSADMEQVEEAIQDNFRSDVVLIPDVSGHLSNSGGKRVRPLLLLLASRACGYEGPRAITQSVVVEYIHTATLLHDDVVDEAEVRRGSESANSKWGNEASVLVGDFLFARSFSMMAKDGSSEILQTMSDTCTLLSEGEVLQLVNMYNVRITEEEYLDVIYRKTAALIAASCRVGALLGDASTPILNALSQFGVQVGYAFQLVDDALDYMGEENRTGKEVGKDLREGNITMPLLRVCAEATPEEFERVNQLVTHSDVISSEDFEIVLELMEKYKTIPYTLDRARSYVEAAKSALSALPDSTHVDSLRAIADYVVERDY
ncbi:MAG: polyprenyl synthetase family protein [Nitrospinota bacterium]|jgi:octaprenyl-diphosphate synthase|nr:polyprenyl synthetase family protein [Nitrospinota bacterium]MDP7167907.1 polyprenyl synthetase family protein [Nitrospinota bacterium]MDP7370153.1 polyprenyl synthetase family protein [Nitrospinota bacterium]MDP7502550.1 polyprenyl synthetase family protein [Nitrospinota bacterium]MDP7661968.1 polyprenyl synthetase family protein [Nitrospinota bacterium]